MSYKIDKVAVLGAGVMGSQLAAHLSNANVPVYLFDINQEITLSGLEACKKLKPSPFYNPKTSELITCYNYNDNLIDYTGCLNIEIIGRGDSEVIIESHLRMGEINQLHSLELFHWLD